MEQNPENQKLRNVFDPVNFRYVKSAMTRKTIKQFQLMGNFSSLSIDPTQYDSLMASSKTITESEASLIKNRLNSSHTPDTHCLTPLDWDTTNKRANSAGDDQVSEFVRCFEQKVKSATVIQSIFREYKISRKYGAARRMHKKTKRRVLSTIFEAIRAEANDTISCRCLLTRVFKAWKCHVSHYRNKATFACQVALPFNIWKKEALISINANKKVKFLKRVYNAYLLIHTFRSWKSTVVDITNTKQLNHSSSLSTTTTLSNIIYDDHIDLFTHRWKSKSLSSLLHRCRNYCMRRRRFRQIWLRDGWKIRHRRIMRLVRFSFYSLMSWWHLRRLTKRRIENNGVQTMQLLRNTGKIVTNIEDFPSLHQIEWPTAVYKCIKRFDDDDNFQIPYCPIDSSEIGTCLAPAVRNLICSAMELERQDIAHRTVSLARWGPVTFKNLRKIVWKTKSRRIIVGFRQKVLLSMTFAAWDSYIFSKDSFGKRTRKAIAGERETSRSYRMKIEKSAAINSIAMDERGVFLDNAERNHMQQLFKESSQSMKRNMTTSVNSVERESKEWSLAEKKLMTHIASLEEICDVEGERTSTSIVKLNDKLQEYPESIVNDLTKVLQKVYKEVSDKKTLGLMWYYFRMIRLELWNKRSVHMRNKALLKNKIRTCRNLMKLYKVMPRIYDLKLKRRAFFGFLMNIYGRLKFITPAMLKTLNRRIYLAKGFGRLLVARKVTKRPYFVHQITSFSCDLNAVFLRWLTYTQDKIMGRKREQLVVERLQLNRLRNCFIVLQLGYYHKNEKPCLKLDKACAEIDRISALYFKPLQLDLPNSIRRQNSKWRKFVVKSARETLTYNKFMELFRQSVVRSKSSEQKLFVSSYQHCGELDEWKDDSMWIKATVNNSINHTNLSPDLYTNVPSGWRLARVAIYSTHDCGIVGIQCTIAADRQIRELSLIGSSSGRLQTFDLFNNDAMTNEKPLSPFDWLIGIDLEYNHFIERMQLILSSGRRSEWLGNAVSMTPTLRRIRFDFDQYSECIVSIGCRFAPNTTMIGLGILKRKVLLENVFSYMWTPSLVFETQVVPVTRRNSVLSSSSSATSQTNKVHHSARVALQYTSLHVNSIQSIIDRQSSMRSCHEPIHETFKDLSVRNKEFLVCLRLRTLDIENSLFRAKRLADTIWERQGSLPLEELNIMRNLAIIKGLVSWYYCVLSKCKFDSSTSPGCGDADQITLLMSQHKFSIRVIRDRSEGLIGKLRMEVMERDKLKHEGVKIKGPSERMREEMFKKHVDDKMVFIKGLQERGNCLDDTVKELEKQKCKISPKRVIKDNYRAYVKHLVESSRIILLLEPNNSGLSASMIERDELPLVDKLVVPKSTKGFIDLYLSNTVFV